ncbi:hypothetical protein AB0B51_37900, partial [Streptomyces griseus]
QRIGAERATLFSGLIPVSAALTAPLVSAGFRPDFPRGGTQPSACVHPPPAEGERRRAEGVVDRSDGRWSPDGSGGLVTS